MFSGLPKLWGNPFVARKSAQRVATEARCAVLADRDRVDAMKKARQMVGGGPKRLRGATKKATKKAATKTCSKPLCLRTNIVKGSGMCKTCEAERRKASKHAAAAAAAAAADAESKHSAPHNSSQDSSAFSTSATMSSSSSASDYFNSRDLSLSNPYRKRFRQTVHVPRGDGAAGSRSSRPNTRSSAAPPKNAAKERKVDAKNAKRNRSRARSNKGGDMSADMSGFLKRCIRPDKKRSKKGRKSSRPSKKRDRTGRKQSGRNQAGRKQGRSQSGRTQPKRTRSNKTKPSGSDPNEGKESEYDHENCLSIDDLYGPQLTPHTNDEEGCNDTSGFETDPRAAVHLYYTAGGLMRENEAPLDDLTTPDPELVEQAVRHFLAATNSDDQKGCAACGTLMSVSEGKMTEHDLGSSSLSHLVLAAPVDAARIDAYQRMSPFGRSAHHIAPRTKAGGKCDGAHTDHLLYAVAQELLDDEDRGWYCKPCLGTTVPKWSSKIGHTRFKEFDYGRPYTPDVGAKPLSILNRLALMRARCWSVHVKLTDASGRKTSNALKSHCFAVPIDGPDVVLGASAAAINEGCTEGISLTFIGEGSAYRLLKEQGTLRAVDVDPVESIRFLRYVQEAGHPMYQGLKIPTENECSLALHRIRDTVLDAADVRDDAVAVASEIRMQNDQDGASLVTSLDVGLTGVQQMAGMDKLLRPLAEKANAADNKSSKVPSDGCNDGDGDGAETKAPEETKASTSKAKAKETIAVGADLINEYEENHTLLHGTFADIFSIGLPEEARCGHLPLHVTKRLYQSYIPVFEQEFAWQSICFNQVLRHEASREVACLARGGSSSEMAKFVQLVKDPTLLAQLDKARQNPDSRECKALMNKMMPLVRNAGQKIRWSPGERQGELTKMYAITYRRGLPSLFITFSRQSANDPYVIKIGSRLVGEDAEVVWSSTDAAGRNACANMSPGTCARRFNAISIAVLEALCGFGAGNESGEKLRVRRKERDPVEMHGVYGEARAAHCITEAQGRGALHLHFLLWLRYGPIFYARFVATAKGREQLTAFLDSIIKAHLSSEVHDEREERVAATAEKKKEASDAFPGVANDITLDALTARGEKIASAVNHHGRHSTRCRKLPSGEYHCSQGKPSQSGVPHTKMVQVEMKTDEVLAAEHHVKGDCRTFERKDGIEDPPDVAPAAGEALGEPDDRPIALVFKRPDVRDGLVVEHTPLVTAVLQCNTAIVALAAGGDSKSGIYYLAKYLSKHPAEALEIIPLLYLARKNAEAYASTAGDVGDQIRDAKYQLTKLLNKITGTVEYSQEMISAALQGYPSSYTTESFTFCFVRSAIGLVRERKKLNDDDSSDSGDSSSSDDESSDEDSSADEHEWGGDLQLPPTTKDGASSAPGGGLKAALGAANLSFAGMTRWGEVGTVCVCMCVRIAYVCVFVIRWRFTQCMHPHNSLSLVTCFDRLIL
jgi:hypothetical protein